MITNGVLTVTDVVGKKYTIQCSCGYSFVRYKYLFDNYSGKCCIKCRDKGKNNGRYKHGGTVSGRLTYSSYHAMRNRCHKTSYWAYQHYGGKGIKICDRWLGKDGYINFVKDLGERPSKKHSLDRIDNSGDYSPENCRWATQQEQTNNMSRNVFYSVNGESKTIAEWSRIYGVNYYTITSRLKKGWPAERAITTKSKGLGANQQTYK